VKVLILHQHFNTPQKGGALRSYYLAKALADRGIKTVVITAHGEKEYRKQDIEGVEVHYLPVPYDNKFGFTARTLAFLKFTFKSARLARRFHDVDVCYAISVPLTVGLTAEWIKRRYNIPFLFEVGDLWPEAPVQLGFVRNYFLRQFLFGLEKRIYRQAQSIVALSSAIQADIESRIPGKTVHLIPNMADIDFYRPSDPEKNFSDPGKFIISYTGAVGVANGLDYFLECANACRKAGLPVKFVLCGEGAMVDRLKASAGRLGLNNLAFAGFVNRNGVRDVLNVSDAAFVCYKNVPILETGSPNKYFDGLAAGKLIVINFGGWIKKEIEDNRCGIYVDPREPTDFVRKIKPFIDDRGQLDQFQEAARRLGETRYSRATLSEKFAALFTKKKTG
jgi:glycosyltransferase involved in cell wall biosynthesis